MAEQEQRDSSDNAPPKHPLDIDHLREWVEYLAGQLAEEDSVQITLIKQGDKGRRKESYGWGDHYMGNPCPARGGQPPVAPYPPASQPDPPSA